MAARFKMSSRGVGQLLNSPMVTAELLRRAEAVKGVAEALSPVGGPGDIHPGQYKRSWYVKLERKAVGRSGKKRPVGVVGFLVFFVCWVVFGLVLVCVFFVLL